VPPALARLVAAEPHLLLVVVVEVANYRGYLRGGERARRFDGRPQRKVYVAVAVAVRQRMQVRRRGRQSSAVNEPL
jgi:hypothetical protein